MAPSPAATARYRVSPACVSPMPSRLRAKMRVAINAFELAQRPADVPWGEVELRSRGAHGSMPCRALEHQQPIRHMAGQRSGRSHRRHPPVRADRTCSDELLRAASQAHRSGRSRRRGVDSGLASRYGLLAGRIWPRNVDDTEILEKPHGEFKTPAFAGAPPETASRPTVRDGSRLRMKRVLRDYRDRSSDAWSPVPDVAVFLRGTRLRSIARKAFVLSESERNEC